MQQLVASNFTNCVGEHLFLQELLTEHQADVLVNEFKSPFGLELTVYAMTKELERYFAHMVLRMRTQRLHLERCIDLPEISK